MEMVSRSTRITEDAEVSGSQFSRREDAKARESLCEAPSARDTRLSKWRHKRERLFLKLPLSVSPVAKLRLRSNESSSMQVSFLCYLPLLLTGCACVALRITCVYFSELQYQDLHCRLLLIIICIPPLFATPTNLIVWVEFARLTTEEAPVLFMITDLLSKKAFNGV